MLQVMRIVAQINRTLRQQAGLALIHVIQANGFSGIVSNMLTHALDQFSPYKHNHEQQYPDLVNPNNGIGLEIKGANKAGKGGESHNGHGGWHLIGCFDLDKNTGNIHFVHIEIAQLVGYIGAPEGDWHYCGSTVNAETGSQRTETYYTTGRGTSKLRDGSVYLDTDRVTNWMRWQHNQSYPIPPYSPLYFQRLDNQMRVPSLKQRGRTVTWATVKSQLNKLDPLWPLYDRQKLETLAIPTDLVEIIRPPVP